MTWQLASRSTVTGTCSPPSVKMRVIPTFCAITPERIGLFLIFPIPTSGSELDLDVHAGRKVQFHERIDGLRRRIDDVEQTLMSPHFKLFAALLVDVRRTVDRKLLNLGRQRDWPTNLRTRTLGRRHDFACRRIKNTVIKRL